MIARAHLSPRLTILGGGRDLPFRLGWQTEDGVSVAEPDGPEFATLAEAGAALKAAEKAATTLRLINASKRAA